MEVAIPIVALVVGCLVTWVVAHFYYKRSTKDFKDLVGKLDKLAQSDKAGVLFPKIAPTGNGQRAEVPASNIVHTPSSPDLYPRIQDLMKDVENVLSKHGFKDSPDTGGLAIA